MSTPHLTVREILQRGHGPEKLAERSAQWVKRDKLRRPIAEKTMYSWFANGIPEKHWSFIMAECEVSLATLHWANEAARKSDGAKTRVRPTDRAQAEAA